MLNPVVNDFSRFGSKTYRFETGFERSTTQTLYPTHCARIDITHTVMTLSAMRFQRSRAEGPFGNAPTG